MLDRAGHNTAFTDAAQAVRTFDIDGIAICDQSVGRGFLRRHGDTFARPSQKEFEGKILEVGLLGNREILAMKVSSGMPAAAAAAITASM